MKKIFLGIFFLLVSIGLHSQRLNSGLLNFNNKDLGISLQYPDSWSLTILRNNVLSFKSAKNELGAFQILIGESNNDSVDLRFQFDALMHFADGAKTSYDGSKQIVSYRTIILQDGKHLEVYHWEILTPNRIISMQYQIDASLKTLPSVFEEVKHAFSIIETLNVFNNE